MSACLAPESTAARPLSAARRHAVRAAALRLGLDDRWAGALAAGAAVSVEGQRLRVQPLEDRPDGAWLATLEMLRPPGLDDAAWHAALLLANAPAPLLGTWGFGLGGADQGLVLMKLPSDEPVGARYLADLLSGVLALGRSVIEALAIVDAAPLQGEPA